MPALFNAERFRRERKKHYTQAQIAEKANTSIRYIRDLEHGKKRNPSAAMLFQISNALEMPMEEFMETTDDDDFL